MLDAIIYIFFQIMQKYSCWLINLFWNNFYVLEILNQNLFKTFRKYLSQLWIALAMLFKAHLSSIWRIFFSKKKKIGGKKKIRLFLMMIMAHMCTPLSIMRPNSEWMTKKSTKNVSVKDPSLDISVTSHRFQIDTVKKRKIY